MATSDPTPETGNPRLAMVKTVIISEERRETLERRGQQIVQIVTCGQAFREGIKASQMIGEGLLRCRWKVVGHGPAVENLKYVGAPQGEDVGHSDL